MIFNKVVVATMIMLAAAASVDKVVAVSASVPQRKVSKNSKKNPPPTLTPEEAYDPNDPTTAPVDPIYTKFPTPGLVCLKVSLP